MRLAKTSRTLLPLALSAVLATCAWAQDRPNIQPNAVRDQLMTQGSGNAQASSAPQAPAPAKPASPRTREGSGKDSGEGSGEGPQSSGEDFYRRSQRFYEDRVREFRESARRKARGGKTRGAARSI